MYNNGIGVAGGIGGGIGAAGVFAHSAWMLLAGFALFAVTLALYRARPNRHAKDEA